MARNLAVAQFVYKYGSDENIAPSGYQPSDDLVNILKGAIVSIGIQAPYPRSHGNTA